MNTIQLFRDYSPDLKDTLCRLFRFITKFKDSEESGLKPVDFTAEGIGYAYDRTHAHGANEKFCIKFSQTLDLIKVLVDEQPVEIYEVSYDKPDILNMANIITHKFKETFRGYESLVYSLIIFKHKYKYKENFKMVKIN